MIGNLTYSKQDYYANILSTIMDHKTLLVISSDFCHWGENFDYFYLRDSLDKRENTISNQIKKLD